MCYCGVHTISRFNFIANSMKERYARIIKLSGSLNIIRISLQMETN